MSVTAFKLIQPSNADLPTLVAVSVTDCNASQPLKRLSPINVSVAGSVTVSIAQPENAYSSARERLPRLVGTNSEHPPNAAKPTFVHALRSSVVSCAQSRNACAPISVGFCAKVTLSSEEQPSNV